MHPPAASTRVALLAALCVMLAACLAPTAPAPDRGDVADTSDVAPPTDVGGAEHAGDAPDAVDAAVDIRSQSTLASPAVTPANHPLGARCAGVARGSPGAGAVPVTLWPGQRSACHEAEAAVGFALLEVPPFHRVSARARPVEDRQPEVSLQRGCDEGAACLLHAFDGQRAVWVNTSPSPVRVIAAVALPVSDGNVTSTTLDITLTEAAPASSCATAPPVAVGSRFTAAWLEAGDPGVCNVETDREPALHYAVDVAPGATIVVYAGAGGVGWTSLSIRASCDPERCVAWSRAPYVSARYHNDGDAPRRVFVAASRRRGDASAAVDIEVLLDEPDAGGTPPPDAAIQPPLPRNTLGSDRCEYRDGAPPEQGRDLVSSAYRRAARPLVWSLGPGDVLWLSHPALEGRTLADVAPGPAGDLLVTRDPAGRVALVAFAEGVEALPEGLAATPSGALMLARVTASASVSNRPLALPAGLALLRFERTGGLAWAEALPSVAAARLDQETDGTARLLATTTAPGTLRGVAFGAAGRRLTAIQFDARDAPARALDLGADPGALDEVVRDLDGALRLRAGGAVLAFNVDGAPRWRAALPPGTHRLRRDGTTWTANADCDALAVPPRPPGAEDPTYLCVSVLQGDGRTRASRRLTRSPSLLSPGCFQRATVSLAESFDGDFTVGIGGEFCSLRSTVPPELECAPNASASWTFRASDPDPLVGPDVSPRCFERSREGLDTRWVGEVRCRLACAASGTCPAPVELTTPANCGALGRACDALLAQLHQRGRCAAGECAATGCLPGWGDCNGDLADGCEVDLSAAAAHCGACGNACAGRCEAGRCCNDGGCAAGVFDSDGSEGAFAPTANVTLAAGVHRFTTIHVPAGVTVYAGEGGVLDLRATDAVRIDGAIELSGGDAYLRLGGATGRRVAGGGPADTGSGPGGGASLGAPARGEAPGDNATGWTDAGSCSGVPAPYECVDLPRSGRADVPAYGASDHEGRHSWAGVVCTGRGFRPLYACNYEDPGAGSIGPRALRDLPVLSRFEPGSGGGSAHCGRNGFGCVAAVAGGGGGGALRIASRASITLGPTATLRADGGVVPYDHGDYFLQWSSGHGSGGVISLAAPSLTVAAGAYVSASSMWGGLGRIKLSVDPARCRVDGTFLPPLPRGCAPSTGDALCETYVAPWPG